MFAAGPGPVGFDRYVPWLSGEPVTVAAPWPVFGLGDQPPRDWIAVDVAELLGELALGEDVDVVVARLPELFAVVLELFCGFGFEHVQGAGEGSGLSDVGFAQEQVDVLGHEDVAEDVELVSLPKLFEDRFEGKSGVVVVEIRQTTVAAEGDEVFVALRLVALETTGHEMRVWCSSDTPNHLIVGAPSIRRMGGLGRIPPIRDEAAYGWGTPLCGWATRPDEWRWSSYCPWLTGEVGMVEIELKWTAR